MLRSSDPRSKPRGVRLPSFAGIFGGTLLGVRASNRLSLYNWESLELVRRIEIQAKQVGTSFGMPQEMTI